LKEEKEGRILKEGKGREGTDRYQGILPACIYMGVWGDVSKAGKKGGLYEGRKEGLHEGRKEGRKEGLQEVRKDGPQEARKEGLYEGRQEGRKEGRTT
jgi:hypothetical protein